MLYRICYLIVISIVTISLQSYAAENKHRIVSLAPSNTAKARDLGLGDCLVGITKFCVRPENATDAVLIGTLSHPNLELISTLNPTLVLGDVESNRPETLDRLEALELNVLRLGPSQNLKDIIRDFMLIARTTGRAEFAKQCVSDLEKRLDFIRTAIKGIKPKRVFVEVWPKPLMTVSRKGFIHHVVEMAGGVNVFADAPTSYPQISIESVIAQNPEVILILTHSLIDDSRVERYREFADFDHAVIKQTDASELSQPSLSSFMKSTKYFLEIIHPDVSLGSDENLLMEDGARQQ